MYTNLERGLPARRQPGFAKWIWIYISIWLIAFLFARTYFIDNVQILLPTISTMAIFLYFCWRLRDQIQDNILGEIGFIYLAFAVAYTVFPAYGFLTLDHLASGVGAPVLETLLPDQSELGLELWRQVLFIVAIGSGYLLFRGRRAARFESFKDFGGAEKPIIWFLFASIMVSEFILWYLSAPVHEYIDNYTRYDNLSWFGTRLVAICTDLITGATFVLLPILFRNYKRYRAYIWPFVLMRVLQEVLGSLGARIGAFMILVATLFLYQYYVKRINLRKGLLLTLAFGLVFSVVELVRSTGFDSSAIENNSFQGQGLPAGELAAVFVPALHLYAERASGSLPPVPWQLFFTDFISIIPLASDIHTQPMYWYAANYFPNAVVPPLTMGPIALSALWGGEIWMVVEGFINGIMFAYLMRWFARDGGGWRVMTVYVFCYATCIMCLKHSIFWHLTPLVRTILPLVIIVSLLAKDTPGSTKRRALHPSRK